MKHIRSGIQHGAEALLEAALIALLVVGLIAGTAFAGKPGSSTAGAFRVDNGVFAGNTLAHQGSSTNTWVRAMCYQGGIKVFEQYRSYDGGLASLTLGPTPMWESGAATCTAQEGSWRRGTTWRAAGSTTFSVSGG